MQSKFVLVDKTSNVCVYRCKNLKMSLNTEKNC